MNIIKIQSFTNGAHDNQIGDFSTIPDGWAVIPEDMGTPNFPFGEVTVEEIDGVMTVTKWVAGTLPEKVETEQSATIEDVLNTLLGVTDDE